MRSATMEYKAEGGAPNMTIAWSRRSAGRIKHIGDAGPLQAQDSPSSNLLLAALALLALDAA